MGRSLELNNLLGNGKELREYTLFNDVGEKTLNIKMGQNVPET